jgi:hypothetical protein
MDSPVTKETSGLHPNLLATSREKLFRINAIYLRYSLCNRFYIISKAPQFIAPINCLIGLSQDLHNKIGVSEDSFMPLDPVSPFQSYPFKLSSTTQAAHQSPANKVLGNVFSRLPWPLLHPHECTVAAIGILIKSCEVGSKLTSEGIDFTFTSLL